jgi:uncharacterized membrane protein
MVNDYRLKSIDLLRGVVMIIMALDHTREFFHADSLLHDPLNLQTTSLFLYFTRWITHFCAPVFVFLAGTSTFLQSLRKSKKELGFLLFSRGLWLVFAELFIMSLAFTFDLHYGLIILQVIWAIGISMILMAALIQLPFRFILTLGIVIVCGHNLLDYPEANRQETFGFIWDLAHKGNFSRYALGTHHISILYPFLPWTGLMLLGYCFGKLFQPSEDAKQRRKILRWTGLGLILVFFCLRAVNSYGDPRRWTTQSSGLFTFLSFINVTKYPPSFLFLCITVGPSLLFLSFVENYDSRLSRIIMVYGRVPFFYYILHFYLVHFISAIFFLLRGHTFMEGVNGIPNFPFKFLVPGEGIHLWEVYLVWIFIVIGLYPVCKWFGDYKMKHRKWWLNYI